MRAIIFIIFTITFFSCGKKTTEAKAERRNITETVFASGTLEPEDKYNLTAQSEGYLLELKFDQGDTVTSGQLLALIDNKTSLIGVSSSESLLNIAALSASKEGPALNQARQNLQLALEKLKQDSVQNERYQKLLQSNSVSKLEAENIRLAWETSRTNYFNAFQNYRLQQQATEQQLIAQRAQRDVNAVSGENTQLRAVVGGRVYKRVKEVGDYVRRGDVIAVIGNADELYAKLSLDENNISKIKLNQEVVLQLNIDKGKNYKGYISEIYPAFDESNQSFYCKAAFVEMPVFRIASTQLQANIVIGQKKDALVIKKAFLNYGNKVMLKDKGETRVETGFISGEWVEILKGIDESAVLISDQVK